MFAETEMQIQDDAILIDLEPQFPLLFKNCREALELFEALFGPLENSVAVSKLQEVTFYHCGRALQMCRSIILLGRFGLGLDCVILARALVEHTINGYYIAYEKKRPGLYAYKKYGRVEQWENFRKLLAFQKKWERTPTIEDQLETVRVQEMRRRFHRSKKWFLNRERQILPSWCKKNLRQRAQFVDKQIRSRGTIEELYLVACQQMGNPVVHGTALGLSQLPRGTGDILVDARPSSTWVPECLRLCMSCMFLIAQLGNRVGKLRRGSVVERIKKLCTPEPIKET